MDEHISLYVSSDEDEFKVYRNKRADYFIGYIAAILFVAIFPASMYYFFS